MKTKWIKGPWEAHSGEDYTVVMRKGECTEDASIHVFGEDAEKLSRLIASAPMLYEALEESLKWLLSSEANEVRKQVVAALRVAQVPISDGWGEK